MTALAPLLLGVLVTCVGVRRLVGARVTRGVRQEIERRERELRDRRFALYVKIAAAVAALIVLLAVAR